MKIVIDCDPGQDDAIAIAMAVGAERLGLLEVLAVTTVAGNVTEAECNRNARVVLDHVAGADAPPVHHGCHRPLVTPFRSYFESGHGLRGWDHLEPSRPAADAHAVDVLVDAAASTDHLTLCALGPLTNIAAAIVMHEGFAASLDRIVLMGGAVGTGNITASAEFNILVDPHAARTVFESGIPLTMIGLEACNAADATDAEVALIREIDTPAAQMTADLIGGYYNDEDRDRGIRIRPMFDPCVIAYLLEPDLFTTRHVRVDVETGSQLTLGRTVVDLEGRSGAPPNATVALDTDSDGFFALMRRLLSC